MLLLISLLVCSAVLADTTNAQSSFNFDSARKSVWENEVGGGFRRHAVEAGIDIGGGPGVAIFGGRHYHDVVLGNLHVGTMLTGPLAKDHFWTGNFELLGTLFGGEQFNHHAAYVVGIAPLLRYNFATGSPFVPFVDGGAGVTLTDIRKPDLSTDFEFNVQAGIGVQWFFKPNMAASLQGRWLHLSNAGIDNPNRGVNTTMILLGLNWFF